MRNISTSRSDAEKRKKLKLKLRGASCDNCKYRHYNETTDWCYIQAHRPADDLCISWEPLKPLLKAMPGATIKSPKKAIKNLKKRMKEIDNEAKKFRKGRA